MIQRFQSVLLLIAAIFMILVLFFPLWQKVDTRASEIASITAFTLRYEKFDPSGERSLISEKQTFYISGLAVVSALVALFSVFQYRNRLRQIQLGALNSLLIGGTLGTALYFILKAEKFLAIEVQGTYQFGFYLPVAALLCNMLANRFIRRDESLVRSADRIR